MLADAAARAQRARRAASRSRVVRRVVAAREARDAGDALRLADQRMYADKSARRAGRPTSQATRRAAAGARASATPSSATTSTTSPARRRASAAQPRPRRASRSTQVRRAAELHDVGKIAIPDAILAQAGPAGRRGVGVHAPAHADRRADPRAPRPRSRPVAALVRSSHERWDGGGYPDGLAGEEIPLGARIIAVCDAYDAMTPTGPTAPRDADGGARRAPALRRARSSTRAVVEALAAVLTAQAVPSTLGDCRRLVDPSLAPRR